MYKLYNDIHHGKQLANLAIDYNHVHLGKP